MDHLILPEDPIPTTLDKVPYLCVEKYDGGPFLTYPYRMRKPWVLPDMNDPLYLPYASFERLTPTPKNEQESFMQAWLFFGLLNEVLGGSYREEDFLTQVPTETGRFILCTKNLRPLLTAACESYFADASYEAQRKFDHFRQCVTLVVTVSFAFQSDFDWRLMCSIIALHEAVVFALNGTARKLGFETIPSLPWAKRFFGEAVCTQMLGGGWCPSDIERAADKFRHTQTLYFLSRMRKDEVHRDHQSCTPSSCSSFQLDLATYQTRHRQPGCRCPEATPKLDDIVKLLKNEELPLLRITQVNEDIESLKIEVVALTPDLPYVSISHVWADGLGNPRRNSVPSCQLSYVLGCVNALRASRAFFADPDTRARDAAGRPLLIWLDTLCCPVSPVEARSLALTQMRRTYQDARHVLVLDAGLQFYASDEISLVEALLRVFLSGWMNRLWTLQEANLARTVWIQFKDKVIDLDALMANMSKVGLADLALLPFTFDMNPQFRSLRPTFPYGLMDGANTSKSVATLLYELDLALHHRSTTVAADEALCIGNLLDLPANEILNVPNTAAARMGRVWELIAAKHGGIPQQIIGFEQPRLDERGKRWAPRSLLVMKHGNSDTAGTRIIRWTNPLLGVPLADGLLVKFSGIRLGLRPPDDDMIRNPWKSIPQIPEYHLLITSEHDGARYKVYSPTNIDAHAGESKAEGAAREPFLHNLVRSMPCALIQLQRATQEKNWTGLLVQIIKNEDGVLYVEHKSHIILSALLPAQNLLYDTAERLARSLRQEPVTAAVANLMPASGSEEDEESDDYKAAVESLKLRIQAVSTEALKDTRLVQAFQTMFGAGEELLHLFWRIVAEWFYHDFVGTTLPDDQIWCVD